MASIGYTHHLRCTAPKCTKRRPYWSDFCKAHRLEQMEKSDDKQQAEITAKHKAN